MQPLPRERLPEVVEEVDRLARVQTDGTVDRAAAEAALREVGLPAELLDEALRQIQARERKKRERRKLLVVAGIALVALGAGGYAIAAKRSAHTHAVEAVHARAAVVSYEEDGLTPVPAADRARPEQVYFNVVLVDMPLGSPLHMECTWKDATGATAHVSSWDTKPVNKAVWPTHCRTKLGTTSPTGTWKVTMTAEGHPVAETSFDVR